MLFLFAMQPNIEDKNRVKMQSEMPRYLLVIEPSLSMVLSRRNDPVRHETVSFALRTTSYSFKKKDIVAHERCQDSGNLQSKITKNNEPLREILANNDVLPFEQLVEMKLGPFHVGGIPQVGLQVVNSDENAAFIGQENNRIFGCALGNLFEQPDSLLHSQ